jgi:hypothetical protein
LKRGRGVDDWTLRGSTDGVRWVCTLSPRDENLPTCRWVAPDIRFDRARIDVNVRIIRRRPGGAFGGMSSTGSLVADASLVAAAGLLSWFRKRNRAAPPAVEDVGDEAESGLDVERSPLGPDWRVDDPAGVLDSELVELFANPPSAFHGGRVGERSVRIDNAHLRTDGIVVESRDGWDSAPALSYQIDLGVALARRVLAVRGE